MNVFAYIMSALLLAAPVQPLEPAGNAEEKISTLITSLGAPTFRVRRAAETRLLALGKERSEPVMERCLEVYLETEDPEVIERLGSVLRGLCMHEFGSERAGFLGVRLQDQLESVRIDDKQYFPVKIIGVLPDMPAKAAGIQADDLILQVDDKHCTVNFRTARVVAYISSKRAGELLRIRFLRGDEDMTKTVRLEKRPPMPNERPLEEQQDAFYEMWLRERLGETRERLQFEREEKILPQP